MDSRDDGFQESVDQAFLAACELDRDSRTPYLATLPEQVRKAVEKLLAAADRAGDQFMQPATSGKDSDPRFEATEPGTGDTQKSATRERSNSSTSQLPGAPIIAHHEIQRVIGEGGMGVVYFAIDQTLSREVAVKLLNQRITNPSTKLRFKFECEIAAEMDHPGIASIYASGVTDDGRPYYVMEYIDGLPITVYCDKMRLSLRDRLKLFAEVCDAIHHAHQKGIVHRDLKPGNILVKANQAQPQVKVIDFGLAKSIHEENAQDLTMVGQVIGTLRYMSPEQTYFDIRKTDIRADVFSLGVLLYEMITGDTPISIDEYRRAARDELYRRIREEAPIAPSRSLDKDPKRSSSIAESRGTDSRSLISRVRGDLDWITLKSLRKERDQRYDSASALAGDVRRYLDHLVVSAGPPSLWYRSRKFIRRNRLTVATTLAFLTLIVGSTIGLAFAAHRARAASRLADQRADFLEVQAEELEKRSVSLSKTVDLLQRREAELVAAVEIGYTLLESEQVGQVDPIPEILRLQSRRKSGKRSTNSPDLQARIELFQLLPSVFQLLRQESAVLEFNDPLEAAAKTSELEPLIARYNAILGQLDRIHKLNAELGFAWLIDAEIRTRAASAFDRSGLAQPLLSSLGFKRSSNEEITSAWKETVRRLPKSTYSHSGYAFWAFGLDDFEVAMKHSDLAMQFGPNSLLAIQCVIQKEAHLENWEGVIRLGLASTPEQSRFFDQLLFEGRFQERISQSVVAAASQIWNTEGLAEIDCIRPAAICSVYDQSEDAEAYREHVWRYFDRIFDESMNPQLASDVRSRISELRFPDARQSYLSSLEWIDLLYAAVELPDSIELRMSTRLSASEWACEIPASVVSSLIQKLSDLDGVAEERVDHIRETASRARYN